MPTSKMPEVKPENIQHDGESLEGELENGSDSARAKREKNKTVWVQHRAGSPVPKERLFLPQDASIPGDPQNVGSIGSEYSSCSDTSLDPIASPADTNDCGKPVDSASISSE